MDLRTEPHFRQAVRTYRFLMNMTNSLMPNGSVAKLPLDVYAVSKSSSRRPSGATFFCRSPHFRPKQNVNFQIANRQNVNFQIADIKIHA
jgi:hypothetical protein